MYTPKNIHTLSHLTQQWLQKEKTPEAVYYATTNMEELRNVLRFHEYRCVEHLGRRQDRFNVERHELRHQAFLCRYRSQVQ